MKTKFSTRHTETYDWFRYILYTQYVLRLYNYTLSCDDCSVVNVFYRSSPWRVRVAQNRILLHQCDKTSQRAIIKFKRSNSSLLLSRVVLFSRGFLVTIIRIIYTRTIIKYTCFMHAHTHTRVLYSFQSLLPIQTIVARIQLARACTLHTRGNAHTCTIQLGHVYL